MWREVKLFVIVIAVSLGTAFFASVALRVDLISIASYLLFGSTDPYLSPEKSKEIGKEFRDEMKKLIQ